MLSKGGYYFDRFMREIPNRRLKYTFRKKEFSKLNVVGQFNHGFIVCTLNGSARGDLFILDQHAVDERNNLEKF
jgi:DNA mismatch repair protein PMS2